MMTEEPEDFEGKWPDPRERSAPARREEMAKFAAELKADPAKALKFFQEAGILNERGELTPQYGGPACVPFKPEKWPVDADGDKPDLCSVCGTPVRYGNRHAKCGDKVQRLIDAAKSVCESAVAHDWVLNRYTKVSPVALDCLRAAVDALERG